MQRDRDGNEYALPGGHVKIGETTSDGLVREYKEETGADIKVEKLLWAEECFWEWNGTQAHNIAFYYLIELADGSDIPDTGEFVSHKDNCNVALGWMPIEKLADLTIYPDFAKEQIHNLDAAIQHFVTRALAINKYCANTTQGDYYERICRYCSKEFITGMVPKLCEQLCSQLVFYKKRFVYYAKL